MRSKRLPYPDRDTDPEMVEAILQCQGDWWLWGQSMCKKPELCIAERACYFMTMEQRATKLGLPHNTGFVVNETARIEACRSCGQAIWWGKTRNGKRNPYDVDNNIRTAVSHFETCPDAEHWSKPKPKVPLELEPAPEPVVTITWHQGVDGFAWAL